MDCQESDYTTNRAFKWLLVHQTTLHIVKPQAASRWTRLGQNIYKVRSNANGRQGPGLAGGGRQDGYVRSVWMGYDGASTSYVHLDTNHDTNTVLRGHGVRSKLPVAGGRPSNKMLHFVCARVLCLCLACMGVVESPSSPHAFECLRCDRMCVSRSDRGDTNGNTLMKGYWDLQVRYIQNYWNHSDLCGDDEQ